MTIDLREPRREVAATLRDLRRARRLVVSDPEIMGGEPVFRGTRVPVHMIAGLVAQGSTQADLLASYPRLTAEMIRLAPVYAAAYPLRAAAPAAVARSTASAPHAPAARHRGVVIPDRRMPQHRPGHRRRALRP